MNPRRFDRAAFELRIGDDPELLREIVELFFDLQPRRMHELELAVAVADSSKIQAIAHMLRGAFGSVSMDSLAELAGTLEASAACCDMAGCTNAMAELSRQFDQVMIELSALRGELESSDSFASAR